jgi:hypothetical protein
MKTYEVRMHIRAECESDARELMECIEEENDNTYIHVLSIFKASRCDECDEDEEPIEADSPARTGPAALPRDGQAQGPRRGDMLDLVDKEDLK